MMTIGDYPIPNEQCKTMTAEECMKEYGGAMPGTVPGSIPIKLTQVKTLNDWFTNLPLIHKIDHYNSHIEIIANNLK